MFEDCPPAAFVDLNFQKIRDAPDLARHVLLEHLKMKHMHIGQIADGVPASDVFPEGPKRIAVLLQPFAEILHNIVGRAVNRRPNTARRIVEGPIPGVVRVGVVIV